MAPKSNFAFVQKCKADSPKFDRFCSTKNHHRRSGVAFLVPQKIHDKRRVYEVLRRLAAQRNKLVLAEESLRGIRVAVLNRAT